MGYSLSVQARNPKLRTRMVDFMEANYRPWWQVVGSKHEAAYSGFRDDVSYGRRKNTLGFDYGACDGLERMYVLAATRWLALKIGKKRAKFKDEGGGIVWESATPVPYYFYDCDTQPTPILVSPTEETASLTPRLVICHACDEVGVPWLCARSWQYEGFEILYSNKRLLAIYQSRIEPFGGDREKILEERNQIICEVAGEEIAKVRGVMHDELKRLDDLWASLPR
jgi:hypothetical protein